MKDSALSETPTLNHYKCFIVTNTHLLDYGVAHGVVPLLRPCPIGKAFPVNVICTEREQRDFFVVFFKGFVFFLKVHRMLIFPADSSWHRDLFCVFWHRLPELCLCFVTCTRPTKSCEEPQLLHINVLAPVAQFYISVFKNHERDLRWSPNQDEAESHSFCTQELKINPNSRESAQQLHQTMICNDIFFSTAASAK